VERRRVKRKINEERGDEEREREREGEGEGGKGQ
jgi:hypothetical protein